ncbi:hypothetical protein BGZ80_004266, partial [Entomortierella chlamydospora]
MFNWLTSQLTNAIETQSTSGSLTLRINAINDRTPMVRLESPEGIPEAFYLKDGKGIFIPARDTIMK